ncbi:hypothetical protein MTO96_013094, partial [Rhipicephalus appendiculatus]
GKLDFETVTKRLDYLEQVIMETLRLYPPGLTFVTRQAKEDFAYKGTQFKAGTCFMAPLYQIQRDPRFWPHPLQFNPERFAPENEAQVMKAAYMPFGVGTAKLRWQNYGHAKAKTGDGKAAAQVPSGTRPFANGRNGDKFTCDGVDTCEWPVDHHPSPQ